MENEEEQRSNQLAQILTDRELAYLSRAIDCQRHKIPGDEPTIAASLNTLIFLARTKSKL